jgi:long-chain fatty acid transport protein
MAIDINDKLSLGFGFRIIDTSGIVKSSGTAAVAAGPTYSKLTRDLKGDTIDYGYNLALAYKPTKELDIGLTYRSKVDLTVDGTATLSETLYSGSYNGDASVTIPLPAVFTAAMAYTFCSKTTVEFTFNRNMWSAYKTLDFNYDGTITNPILIGAFDKPVTKNWNDTNAYRLGVTQSLDSITLMAGMVYDESAIPDETLSFELPGSSSLSVSLGGRYELNEKFDVGLSALYSMKETRSVTNEKLSGEFSNANVLLVSAGVGYKF